jgi:hypothetical protein
MARIIYELIKSGAANGTVEERMHSNCHSELF